MALFESSLGAIVAAFGFRPAYLRLVSKTPEFVNISDGSCSPDDDFYDIDFGVLAEREQQRVTGLRRATGRDLKSWLSAVGRTRLAGRNAIVDWLLSQDLSYADASWIERVRHNGGQLLYAEFLKTEKSEKADSVQEFMTLIGQTFSGRVMTAKALFRLYRKTCRDLSLAPLSLKRLQREITRYPEVIERKRDSTKPRGRLTLYTVKQPSISRAAA